MTRLERMIVDVVDPRQQEMRDLPASFRIAAMALSRVKAGRLDFHFPDGRTFRFSGEAAGPVAEVMVNDPTFARAALAKGDIGFAEAYMDGRIDTPDMALVLEFFTRNFDQMREVTAGGALTRMVNNVRHALRANSRKGSKRNILAHYDLGNSFYEEWLDPTMTYSSGIYESDDDSLEQSQVNKYRSMTDMLALQPGQRVLEIGGGWGGFAEYAARNHDVEVDSITISDAQFEFASQRIAKAGLSDRVHVRLCDYRDLQDRYDAVASIEMFEAVGEKYWPTYFSKIHEVLKPGGRAALQIITIDDEVFERYRKRMDFIQAYIFPGGMLPSVSRLKDEIASAGLAYETSRMFGIDYARTLASWKVRFDDAWESIRKMGFDERFRRLWLYYLAYCEAGFRTGRIDVGQFVMTRPR